MTPSPPHPQLFQALGKLDSALSVRLQNLEKLSYSSIRHRPPGIFQKFGFWSVQCHCRRLEQLQKLLAAILQLLCFQLPGNPLGQSPFRPSLPTSLASTILLIHQSPPAGYSPTSPKSFSIPLYQHIHNHCNNTDDSVARLDLSVDTEEIYLFPCPIDRSIFAPPRPLARTSQATILHSFRLGRLTRTHSPRG